MYYAAAAVTACTSDALPKGARNCSLKALLTILETVL
jgi:hypothetical protein